MLASKLCYFAVGNRPHELGESLCLRQIGSRMFGLGLERDIPALA